MQSIRLASAHRLAADEPRAPRGYAPLPAAFRRAAHRRHYAMLSAD